MIDIGYTCHICKPKHMHTKYVSLCTLINCYLCYISFPILLEI